MAWVRYYEEDRLELDVSSREQLLMEASLELVVIT